MAGSSPHRAAGWTRVLAHWPSLVLPLWWLGGAAWIVVAGFRPDPYLVHVAHVPPEQQSYNVAAVGFAVLFTAVEAGLLAAVLRPASYPRWGWRRAVGALGVWLPFAFLHVVTLMHAPPSAVVAAMWSLATLPLLLGLAVALEIRARRV